MTRTSVEIRDELALYERASDVQVLQAIRRLKREAARLPQVVLAELALEPSADAERVVNAIRRVRCAHESAHIRRSHAKKEEQMPPYTAPRYGTPEYDRELERIDRQLKEIQHAHEARFGPAPKELHRDPPPPRKLGEDEARMEVHRLAEERAAKESIGYVDAQTAVVRDPANAQLVERLYEAIRENRGIVEEVDVSLDIDPAWATNELARLAEERRTAVRKADGTKIDLKQAYAEVIEERPELYRAHVRGIPRLRSHDTEIEEDSNT